MSAVSAITAHIGVSNLVAISSSRRANAPRMICSAHFMNMPRPQFSSNSFKSNITKNGGTKGFFNSSSKQSRASFTPCAALVNVEFLVPELPLEFGQSLKIVGGAPSLGNWEASTGAVLEWQEGNNWKGAAEVEAGSEVEFKLVKVAGEDWSSWEDGENKVFAIPATATGVEVICLWEGDISIELLPLPLLLLPRRKKNAAPQEPAAVAAPAAVVVAEKEEKPSHQEKEKDAPAESAPTHSNGAAAAPSTGVDISSEMSSLANTVSVGSDGSLMIEFNSNADGVTAASLAAKLK
ncbi:hypothetical protein NADE_000927 [Nannochloris sp. 'desiccata']|nr:hypothetical protein NADE_000927 [Chlorella desiccata (nom. nud.)]